MLKYVFPLMLIAAPTLASPILDNPGYCDLPDAEAELADIWALSETELASHGLYCTWRKPIKPGKKARRRATCGDGAREWRASIGFSALTHHRIRVSVEPENNIPRYFFPCSEWRR